MHIHIHTPIHIRTSDTNQEKISDYSDTDQEDQNEDTHTSIRRKQRENSDYSDADPKKDAYTPIPMHIHTHIHIRTPDKNQEKIADYSDTRVIDASQDKVQTTQIQTRKATMKILIRASDASREKIQRYSGMVQQREKILIRASNQNEDTHAHIRRKQRGKSDYSGMGQQREKILMRASDQNEDTHTHIRCKQRGKSDYSGMSQQREKDTHTSTQSK